MGCSVAKSLGGTSRSAQMRSGRERSGAAMISARSASGLRLTGPDAIPEPDFASQVFNLG